MTTNTCKVPACAVRIAGEYLFCKTHWMQVDSATRGLINQCYKLLQQTDDPPLAVNAAKKYREAVDLAVMQVESRIQNPRA
jgi:hypothetical protein